MRVRAPTDFLNHIRHQSYVVHVQHVIINHTLYTVQRVIIQLYHLNYTRGCVFQEHGEAIVAGG